MAVNEMGKYLRQVVDNPLEEGQFENAIAMLDQLRSPDHTPSVIHLLHLIFIALHPASHPCRLDHTSGLDPVLDSATLLLQSPRKIIKQTKSALVLSPSAVLAAQTLLHSFLLTNGPAALAPALPAYPETKNAQPPSFESVESPICNQATAVKGARSVWEILKSGFVNKTMTMFGTPKGRGKQAKGSALSRDSSFTVNVNEWESQGEIKPVGDDAWPVLDWLVALFESDAEITEKSGQPKHSPLLLKQLPPPPIGSTTRWDASEPLKVVFYALQQTENRRQRIGLRLFHLLIDLTQTLHLNLPSFTSTVLSQLAASCSSSAFNTQLPSPIPSTPTTPPRNSPGAPSSFGKPLTHQEALTSLFTHLSPTPSPSCLAFRMALCRKILAELDGGGGGSLESLQVNSNNVSGFGSSANAVGVNGTSSNATGSFSSGVQPQAGKPRPRPVPRALAAARKAEQANGDVGPASAPSSSAGTKTTLIVSPPTPLASTTSTGSSSTTVSATPAPPPLPPLPPLFPLADIARLLSLRPPSLPPQAQLAPNPNPTQSRKPPSRSGGRMNTRRSVTPAPAPPPTYASNPSSSPNGGMPSLPSHPWTSPSPLLLRVKFELLGAWIGLRTIRRERERGRVGLDGKPEKEKDDNASDAALLPSVIEDVFGRDLGGVSEREGEKEREERLFYRDVLRAFAGLPVQV